jgi:hypothetical protein
MNRPTTASEQPKPTHAIARSFYDQLAREGFTPQQVVSLATTLLDLVHADLHRSPEPARAK